MRRIYLVNIAVDKGLEDTFYVGPDRCGVGCAIFLVDCCYVLCIRANGTWWREKENHQQSTREKINHIGPNGRLIHDLNLPADKKYPFLECAGPAALWSGPTTHEPRSGNGTTPGRITG